MSNYPAIDKLLPHDRPMILIDRAIKIEENGIHCQTSIDETNPFFNSESEIVPAYVGIEFMAQAIAAWSGYNALSKGERPPIGFLLGSRAYKSQYDVYHKGQLLDIYAEQMMENDGMAAFMARIECNAETVASCRLNVYVPSEQKLSEMKFRSQI